MYTKANSSVLADPRARLKKIRSERASRFESRTPFLLWSRACQCAFSFCRRTRLPGRIAGPNQDVRRSSEYASRTLRCSKGANEKENARFGWLVRDQAWTAGICSWQTSGHVDSGSSPGRTGLPAMDADDRLAQGHHKGDQECRTELWKIGHWWSGRKVLRLRSEEDDQELTN